MKLLLANVIVSLLLPEVSLAQTDRAGPTAQNLRTLNESACAIFQKGHVPIIGVNLALPIIETRANSTLSDRVHVRRPETAGPA
jgi:hypothetical protein